MTVLRHEKMGAGSDARRNGRIKCLAILEWRELTYRIQTEAVFYSDTQRAEGRMVNR
jgi:hypothetical protein